MTTGVPTRLSSQQSGSGRPDGAFAGGRALCGLHQAEGGGGRIAAQPSDAGTAARGPDMHQVKLERSRRIDDDVRLMAVVAD